MKKRIETTIETHQVQLVRRRKREIEAWCDVCRGTVRMVPPESAVALAKVSLRAVFQRVEAGEFHFIETDDGMLYVCANSVTHRAVPTTC